MSNFTLNLPVDIPWRRKCITENMIDDRVCDKSYPNRWEPSIAVFEYQPPDEYQEYQDQGMIVSYLKVVCSITGHQLTPEQRVLGERTLKKIDDGTALIENYKNVLGTYYPCYGAILEVIVGPGNNVPKNNYPYISDFEPKKRELYELVSQTGEMSSMSSRQVFVGKSNSSLKSHETLNVLNGVSGNMATSAGVAGVQASGAVGASVQGQWGTIDRTENQEVSIRNTNTSQEARETQSHTTQLTQMYHQLDSYHLGTNRALFFVHPRPHVVQTEFTFVNGPRNIEGIQEFFLVIMRPTEVESVCVEAYLETAHINKYEANYEETDAVTDPYKLVNDEGEVFDDAITIRERMPTYIPPDGWAIDLTKDDGYNGFDVIDKKIKGRADLHLIRVTENKIEIDLTATSYPYLPEGARDARDAKRMHSSYEYKLRVFLKTKLEDTLYIIGRKCCSCKQNSNSGKPCVVYEYPFDIDKFGGKLRNLPINVANLFGVKIKEIITKSINDPRRYRWEAATFLETDFVSNAISKLFDQKKNGEQISLQNVKISMEKLNEGDKLRAQKIFRNLKDKDVQSILKERHYKLRNIYNLSQEDISFARKIIMDSLR